jgi:hypothetical protein
VVRREARGPKRRLMLVVGRRRGRGFCRGRGNGATMKEGVGVRRM